ncbi:carboxymuconolactone decarboxylase [Chitinophaga silvatica]|uniref:Carboxymuconolactone decarboxylase n=1 Tax=Chitinophaga silvatica TaxID=2282649 RepID=A0A3E1YH87_9BACT|nr:carboxymuconolactone decarboxylase family protein [Chitinophaga silvatica]RFS26737.1 carboxymuconolactone decarboxylase [Chitinophaga silvatica]
MKQIFRLLILFTVFGILPIMLWSQNIMNDTLTLNAKQKAVVAIAALTAKGDLPALKSSLSQGLESGLTVNQIKEVLIHIYAYAGFPRSIRGLQTFMTILDERKANGIVDIVGIDASPINEDSSKYNRGKQVLENLTGVTDNLSKTGYAAFAPTIEKFLKEHLFADIFERDILSYSERELATISVLSSIGEVEPMLYSHLNICLNVGLKPGQLHQFVGIINQIIGANESIVAQRVLDEVLKSKN